MNDTISSLAWAITWVGSKQAYFTSRLMVDKGLKDDFARAYAYLRWADDVVDDATRSKSEGISFIRRQRRLLDSLYLGEHPTDLVAEEEMLDRLVANDRGTNSGLQSFICNMIAVIEFDAHRKGRLISGPELEWYTERVANSVTDGLDYFVGHGSPHLTGPDRLMAVKACHISHLLRDSVSDVTQGFINIPREYLEVHNVEPGDVRAPQLQEWVRDRVGLAREYFNTGKQYFHRTHNLRAKIVVYWYCARFERVLDAIERDRFILRESYSERRKLPALVKLLWMVVPLSIQHAFGQMSQPSYH